MGSKGYQIVHATVTDRPRLMDFLRQHYFSHEPLYQSLGESEGPSCSSVIPPLVTLSKGYSLMAVEEAKDGGEEEIIGVCLNEEIEKLEEGKDRTEFGAPLSKVDSKLYDLLEKNGYFWEELGVAKTFDLYILAVDSSQRRRGIGQTLVLESMDLARDEGYQAVSMQCTSHYSASLAEKLGMRCLLEVKYSEYLGDDGYPVFNPPPPHQVFKSFVHKFE